MSQITDQIKEKLDIVEFLKEYIQVLPAGRNFRALCPFHKENNPSLMISSERQSWYCFGGCNDGGDIFKFLMKYENLEFGEALRVLAEKAGIILKNNPSIAREHQQIGIFYEINNAAKDFFKKNLTGAPFDYLLKRGLKKETISEFELGFASAPDFLMRHLIGLGFSVNDIERAGLIIRTSRGNYWDRFRNRIMFPIANSFGKIVGFTGRIFGDEGVELIKYLNSPETLIFNKSKLLYGLHKSKPYIRQTGWILLVEGQMDFLMTYQDGVKNIVASSGTALTNEHLKILRRLAGNLMLSFDKDEAGQLAAERSIDLATANDFTVKILNVFSGKDPADMVREHPGVMRKIISEAQPAFNFYLERYLKNTNNQKSGIRVVLSKIRNVFSSIEQAAWLRELSNQTGIGERVLMEEISKLPKNPGRQNSITSDDSLNSEFRSSNESWSRKQEIAARILDLGGNLPKESLISVPDKLALKVGLENSQLNQQQREAELGILQQQLTIESLKDRQQLLKQTIVKAEREKDGQSLAKALAEFDIISKKFHNLNNKYDSQKTH